MSKKYEWYVNLCVLTSLKLFFTKFRPREIHNNLLSQYEDELVNAWQQIK